MAHSIFNRYKHYNPAEEGYGSADEWAKLADALADRVMGGFAPDMAEPVRKAGRGRKNPDLETLMLDKLPDSLDRLKTAYRNCLHLYHPDHGGNEEQCRLLIEAYQRLLKSFRKKNATKIQRLNR